MAPSSNWLSGVNVVLVMAYGSLVRSRSPFCRPWGPRRAPLLGAARSLRPPPALRALPPRPAVPGGRGRAPPPQLRGRGSPRAGVGVARRGRRAQGSRRLSAGVCAAVHLCQEADHALCHEVAEGASRPRGPQRPQGRPSRPAAGPLPPIVVGVSACEENPEVPPGPARPLPLCPDVLAHLGPWGVHTVAHPGVSGLRLQDAGLSPAPLE